MPKGPKPHFLDSIVDATTGKQVFVAENSTTSTSQSVLIDVAERNTIVDDDPTGDDCVLDVGQFRDFIGVDACVAARSRVEKSDSKKK